MFSSHVVVDTGPVPRLLWPSVQAYTDALVKCKSPQKATRRGWNWGWARQSARDTVDAEPAASTTLGGLVTKLRLGAAPKEPKACSKKDSPITRVALEAAHATALAEGCVPSSHRVITLKNGATVHLETLIASPEKYLTLEELRNREGALLFLPELLERVPPQVFAALGVKM